MRIRRTLGAVIGTVVVTAPLTSAPAHAALAEDEQDAVAEVYSLAIVPGEPGDPLFPLTWGNADTALLTCDPAGGTHPEADGACAEIDRAGSIAAIDRPALCPLVFSPVTAYSWGAETYEETYANPCFLKLEKGAVFDFMSRRQSGGATPAPR
ncbi:SSI family serine proteinase inhibitor [Nocardiopsis rhodophaea]